MPLLDTSVVVRYLTDDPPNLAEEAAGIIDEVPELALTNVVVAETAHVLTSVYCLPRETVVDRLIELLQRENIVTPDATKELVIAALLLCRPSGRVSVPDALLWAAARDSEDGVIYSFDRRFPTAGVTVRSAR